MDRCLLKKQAEGKKVMTTHPELLRLRDSIDGVSPGELHEDAMRLSALDSMLPAESLRALPD